MKQLSFIEYYEKVEAILEDWGVPMELSMDELALLQEEGNTPEEAAFKIIA